MSDQNLVRPLTPAQVDQQVAQDKDESYAHKVVVAAVDQGAGVVAGLQPYQTISADTAETVAARKKGVVGFFARLLQRGLNLVTPGHNHGTGALIADDVRNIEAEKKIETSLDTIDPSGAMVAEIHKDEQ